MKLLLNIARIVEGAQSLIELIKLGMITIICWQAFSFGSMIVDRMEDIESGLASVTNGLTVFTDKSKQIADGIVSQEFEKKTDQMTESVVDAKNNFLERFKAKDESK